MAKKIMLIAIVLLFTSCFGQDMSTIKDSNGYTFIGNWEKLTIHNKDTVVRIPYDAYNAQIKIDKNNKTIFVRYGIEDIAYDIVQVNLVDDVFIIELQYQKEYTKNDTSEHIIFKCKRIDKDKALWTYIDNCPAFLFTNAPNKYSSMVDVAIQDSND